MLKKGLLSLLLFLLLSCGNTEFTKVNWKGNLIKQDDELNYLYWRDGVQFLNQEEDSLRLGMAGFAHDEFIYILVSLSNQTNKPITFFPKDSHIIYYSKGDTIILEPIKPKNLDKSHFSFFNTILIGAGSISRLFINLPVDMFLSTDSKEDGALSKIDEDYHTEGGRITKKIFISAHTLFSEDDYAGFLVFEYNDDYPVNKDPFNVKIMFGQKEYTGQGMFTK